MHTQKEILVLREKKKNIFEGRGWHEFHSPLSHKSISKKDLPFYTQLVYHIQNK